MKKKTTTVGEFLRAYGREDLYRLIENQLRDDDMWTQNDTDILIQQIFDSDIQQNDYVVLFYPKSFIAKAEPSELPDLRPSCYILEDLYNSKDLFHSAQFKKLISDGDIKNIYNDMNFPEEYNIYLLPIDILLGANLLKENLAYDSLEKYYLSILTALTIYTPKERREYATIEINAPVFDDIFVSLMLSLCDDSTESGKQKKHCMEKKFYDRAIENVSNFAIAMNNISW